MELLQCSNYIKVWMQFLSSSQEEVCLNAALPTMTDWVWSIRRKYLHWGLRYYCVLLMNGWQWLREQPILAQKIVVGPSSANRTCFYHAQRQGNIATGETSQVITSRYFSSLLFTSLIFFTSLTISLLWLFSFLGLFSLIWISSFLWIFSLI